MMTKTTFQELHQELTASVQKIRDNPNLSDAGKQRMIAAAYVRSDAANAQLRADQVAEAAASRRAVEARLFGLNNADRRDPALVMSHRDAIARAAQVTTPEEAETLLRSAALGGDKVFAKALLGVAFSKGYQQVVDVYVDEMPADVEDIDELVAMNAADSAAQAPENRVLGSVLEHLPKPAELRDAKDDSTIRKLAAEAGEDDLVAGADGNAIFAAAGYGVRPGVTDGIRITVEGGE